MANKVSVSILVAATLLVSWFASLAADSRFRDATSTSDRAVRLASSIPPVAHGTRSRQSTLSEWMDALAVPGLSVAVIDDWHITLTVGYGVTEESDGGKPITPETLFQAASIAKPITALAVLRQVERGRFELDRDVNSYLTSWKIPSTEALGSEVVTIRRLLAHTGGVTAGGFAGYARSEPLPNIQQVLSGTTPATNSPALVVARPGAEVAYSGLGYSILQLMLEEANGTRFDSILDKEVFDPLQLQHTSFRSTFADEHMDRVALGHFATGVPVRDGWRVFPELAAAGLWTTARDLATIVLDVARASRGEESVLLSSDMAKKMLTAERDEMGLGFVVRPQDPNGFFAHSGGNTGYYAHFRMLADAGKGVVVMTNSESGQLLAPLVMASVAGEFNWPADSQIRISERLAQLLFEQIDRIERGTAVQRVAVKIDSATLERYVGQYELSPGLHFNVTLNNRQLMLRLGDQPQFPLMAESPTKFFLEAVDAQITFVVDERGHPTALILHQAGRDQEAPRVVIQEGEPEP